MFLSFAESSRVVYGLALLWGRSQTIHLRCLDHIRITMYQYGFSGGTLVPSTATPSVPSHFCFSTTGVKCYQRNVVIIELDGLIAVFRIIFRATSNFGCNKLYS